jgi:hypothetical protein
MRVGHKLNLGGAGFEIPPFTFSGSSFEPVPSWAVFHPLPNSPQKPAVTNPATIIRSSFARLAIRVPQGSRIELSTRVAEMTADDVSDYTAKTPHNFAKYLIAAKEANELAFICEQLLDRMDESHARNIIGRLLHDEVLPKPTAKTFGRDKQFELYLGALLHAAGCTVRLAEPDWVVEAAGIQFGIAAKRMKSEKKAVSTIQGSSRATAAPANSRPCSVRSESLGDDSSSIAPLPRLPHDGPSVARMDVANRATAHPCNS